MPTPEQLQSRKQVETFLERTGKLARKTVRRINSAWFGRPTEELQGWIERGRAIDEIKDSMGYRLILDRSEQEITWAQRELESCKPEDLVELRLWLKCNRMYRDFILTTERNAQISSEVLEGRASAIARESLAFVKNARVEN